MLSPVTMGQTGRTKQPRCVDCTNWQLSHFSVRTLSPLLPTHDAVCGYCIALTTVHPQMTTYHVRSHVGLFMLYWKLTESCLLHDVSVINVIDTNREATLSTATLHSEPIYRFLNTITQLYRDSILSNKWHQLTWRQAARRSTLFHSACGGVHVFHFNVLQLPLCFQSPYFDVPDMVCFGLLTNVLSDNKRPNWQ
jgi:hypothetical protein